ncbi:MAG: hypothetical protein WCP11_00650 [Candidatus Saccharibacteria bacterium]
MKKFIIIGTSIAALALTIIIGNYLYTQNANSTAMARMTNSEAFSNFDIKDLTGYRGDKDYPDKNFLMTSFAQYQTFLSEYGLTGILPKSLFDQYDYLLYFDEDGTGCTGTETGWPVSADITNQKINLLLKRRGKFGNPCAVLKDAYLIPIEKNKISALPPIDYRYIEPKESIWDGIIKLFQ